MSLANKKKSNRGHDILLHTFIFILAYTQKSIQNNFYDEFIQFSGKYKKYLAHIGIPANVQNNYIKLSGFLILNLKKSDSRNNMWHKF